MFDKWNLHFPEKYVPGVIKMVTHKYIYPMVLFVTNTVQSLQWYTDRYSRYSTDKVNGHCTDTDKDLFIRAKVKTVDRWM